jgi:hypothetical protein
MVSTTAEFCRRAEEQERKFSQANLREAHTKDMRKRLSEDVAACGLPRLNILLVGRTGAGKSSVTNTFASAVSGKSIRIADTCRFVNDKTNTRFLSPIQLGESNVFVWDMRGYEGDSDDDAFELLLSSIVRGVVPVGTDLIGNEWNSVCEAHGDSARQMHLVCCVVNSTAADDLKNSKVVQLASNAVRRMHVPLCVLCTNLDVYSPAPGISYDPACPWSILKKIPSSIVDKLSVGDAGRIFFSANYCHNVQDSMSEAIVMDTLTRLVAIVLNTRPRSHESSCRACYYGMPLLCSCWGVACSVVPRMKTKLTLLEMQWAFALALCPWLIFDVILPLSSLFWLYRACHSVLLLILFGFSAVPFLSKCVQFAVRQVHQRQFQGRGLKILWAVCSMGGALRKHLTAFSEGEILVHRLEKAKKRELLLLFVVATILSALMHVLPITVWWFGVVMWTTVSHAGPETIFRKIFRNSKEV